jgi:outer membrane biosynthesis protein TonB
VQNIHSKTKKKKKKRKKKNNNNIKTKKKKNKKKTTKKKAKKKKEKDQAGEKLEAAICTTATSMLQGDGDRQFSCTEDSQAVGSSYSSFLYDKD